MRIYCGLVEWYYAEAQFPSEILATDPEVPGSIPGATRFSEK
jgi:hypothetical protein